MSAIEAGWLYSGPRTCEHSQGWFVPVMDKNGTLNLVDTYVVKSCYSRKDKNVSAMTEAIMEMGTEPHPYMFSRILGDYYHGCQYIHHFSDLPDGWEKVCYLPEWEYVSDDEARGYEPRDVIWFVQLHFEHGFRWHGYQHGVCLRRKGAIKSFDRQLDAAISDAHRSMTYPSTGWGVTKAKELHDGLFRASPKIEARYRDMIEVYELLDMQAKEMRELLDAQAARRREDTD